MEKSRSGLRGRRAVRGEKRSAAHPFTGNPTPTASTDSPLVAPLEHLNARQRSALGAILRPALGAKWSRRWESVLLELNRVAAAYVAETWRENRRQRSDEIKRDLAKWSTACGRLAGMLDDRSLGALHALEAAYLKRSPDGEARGDASLGIRAFARRAKEIAGLADELRRRPLAGTKPQARWNFAHGVARVLGAAGLRVDDRREGAFHRTVVVCLYAIRAADSRQAAPSGVAPNAYRTALRDVVVPYVTQMRTLGALPRGPRGRSPRRRAKGWPAN